MKLATAASLSCLVYPHHDISRGRDRDHDDGLYGYPYPCPHTYLPSRIEMIVADPAREIATRVEKSEQSRVQKENVSSSDCLRQNQRPPDSHWHPTLVPS